MAFDLLHSVKGLFTSDLISKAASSLGESEAGISKAMSGIIPSVLGSIISKATSDIDGASNILNLAKGVAGSGLLSNLGNMFGESGSANLVSNGVDMAKWLLGNKMGRITGMISSFAGIREFSIPSLMAMTAPAALGILGKQVIENDLTPSSLSNMLSSQKASMAAALPAGLSSLAGLTGLSPEGSMVLSLTDSVKQTTNSIPPVAVYAEKQADDSRRWSLPIVFAGVIIALVWLFVKGCDKEVATNVPGTDTTSGNSPMPVSAEPVSIKVQLPDGIELDAYKGGIEDQLVTYLNSTDPADSISNSRWFDFDNLNFKTGSAELTAESMKQAQNIAAILKAYPKVSIKIGGYADKTGKEEENMKLSQQRAESVLDALKKTGAAGTRLAGAKGYGSQFAKAAMDAPDEERRLDRRISISVRSK